MNSRLRVAAGAAALVVALSGCGVTSVLPGGSDDTVPEIAATVLGQPITSTTVEELSKIFATTAAGQQAMQGTEQGLRVSEEQVRQTALSYQIRVVFLEALAKERNVKLDADDNQEIYDSIAEAPSLQQSGYRGKDLAVAARAEALSKEIAQQLLPDVKVNEDELQEEFQKRENLSKASFRSTTNVAFMDDQKSADQLKSRVEGGETFDTVTKDLGDSVLQADTVSVSPLSPVQKEFISTVQALKQGEVSEPLERQVADGSLYIVLHQEKREDLPALTLKDDAIRAEMTEIVQDNKRFAFFDQWFNKRFKEAKITVDDYYGEWNPSFLAVT